jgi:hypothetical protein
MSSGCQSAEMIQLVNEYSARVEASQYRSDQFDERKSVNGVYPTLVIKQKDYDHYVVWLTLYSESPINDVTLSDIWVSHDVGFASPLTDLSEGQMAKSGLYESVNALLLLEVDSVKAVKDSQFDLSFTFTVKGKSQRMKFSINKVSKYFTVSPT